MKIKLIDEWRKALRMASIQAMTAATALQVTWVSLPPNLIEKVPANVVNFITMGLLVLGVIGRLVKQDKVSGSDQP